MKSLTADQLDLFNERDERAFSALFTCYQPRLHYYATKLIDDRATAEEIVSDAFLKIWTSARQFPQDTDVIAFLYVCVRNACYNFLRANAKKPIISMELTPEEFMKADIDKQEYIKAELLAAIFHQIDQLSPTLKKVMQLRYLDEQKIADIASEMGIAVSTVRTHLRDGNQLLRVHFKNSPILPTLLAFLQLFP